MIATIDDKPQARGAVAGRRAVAVVAAFFAACALAFAGAAAAQSNSIDSVAVSKGTSGRTIVKFTLKSPPANPPAGFAIASPPRIALDFLDTGNDLGTSQRAIEDSALRSLNLINANGRTRVVFNLNKPQTFETEVEGNSVLVTLFDQSEQLAPTQQQVQRFAEARAGDVEHSLRDIDFRRGRNGEGRIVVDLSDNSTGIDIRQQGRALIVDFIKTSLPQQPAAPPRRAGLRHAGGLGRHVRAGRQHADGDRAEGHLGALRLPDRQQVHPRSEAGAGGSEQARRRARAAATRARSCRSTSRTSKCARCCR